MGISRTATPARRVQRDPTPSAPTLGRATDLVAAARLKPPAAEEPAAMPEIRPRDSAIAALPQQVPARGALVMLNLLRFNTWASYPDAAASSGAARSGREAYALYSGLTLPHLRRVGGRVIFKAKASLALIAAEGEHWDEVLLVRYPNRAAFVSMTSDAGFQAGSVHRSAALADSRLIIMAEPKVIGRLGWWLFGLLSRWRQTQGGAQK